jgi:hypothetical protein
MGWIVKSMRISPKRECPHRGSYFGTVSRRSWPVIVDERLARSVHAVHDPPIGGENYRIFEIGLGD